jgi:hypothetical protein
MMLYSPSTEQYTIYDQSCGAAEIEQIKYEYSNFDTSISPMEKLEVGDTVYKFVKCLKRFDIPSENGFVSRLSGLNKYIGKGDTAEEAFWDLRDSIHADYQQLQRKRPFEMSEEERTRWSDLAKAIDILDYKMTTPLVVREIGQVSYGKISRPHRIKWITGENYIIASDKVPGDLMACRPSEWIEAVVKRDPVNNQVLEIESISRMRFRIPTDTEIRKFWDNIPSANLPRGDWSW